MAQPPNANSTHSTLGIRFFNIYNGSRKENEDHFEKFGRLNVFCLNKAFGKEVILREGVCCEIKTTQIALRILFGFAALATLPLTLVGIVLIVLSKSHKKIHQEALAALKLPLSISLEKEEPVLSNVLPSKAKEEPVLSNVLPSQVKEEPVLSNVLPSKAKEEPILSNILPTHKQPDILRPHQLFPQENSTGRLLFNFPSKEEQNDPIAPHSSNPFINEITQEGNQQQNPNPTVFSNEQQQQMAAVFLHMVALSTMMQQNTGAFVPGAETKNNSTQLPEALNNLLIELQRIASLSTEKFKSLTLDPENLTQEIICQEEANLKKQLDQIKCHFEEDIKVILTSKAIQSEKSEQFESSLSKLKAEFYAAYEAKLQELSNSAKSLIAILNQTLSSDTETNEPQAEPNLKAAETKKIPETSKNTSAKTAENSLDASLKSTMISEQMQLLLKTKIFHTNKLQPIIKFIEKQELEGRSLFNSVTFNKNDLLGRAIEFDRTDSFVLVQRVFEHLNKIPPEPNAHPKLFADNYLRYVDVCKVPQSKDLKKLIKKNFQLPL